MTTPERPLRRPKMAAVVADAIADDILARGLRPGDVLPTETAMIEQYGIARSTLREALLLLESDGLLTVRPGRAGGPVVQRPTPENLVRRLSLLLSVSGTPFADVMRAREVIEPELVAGAARHASAEQRAALAASVRDLAAAIDDEPAFLQLNQDFHGLIARAAGNEVLAAFWFAIQRIADGHQVGIRFSRGAREDAIRAHRRILDAIEAGDAAAASRVMAHHLDGFTALVAERYPELLSDQVQVVRSS
jgi:GntR family transcriptional regulator, transcriptional repressor for pyruvate dehydrogenase complex